MLFDLNPKESPSELFGRDEEISMLTDLIKARRWIALLGRRMMGKTSILKTLATKVREEQGIKSIYINLWGVKGIDGLLNLLIDGINNEKGIIERIKDTIKSIDIGISVSMVPLSLQLSPHALNRPTLTLQRLLSSIGRDGDNYIIMLDEVQELAGVSIHLLRVLANIFNTYPNIIFIFTGSMSGLIRTLLEPTHDSPLYGRSPAVIYIKPFSIEKSKAFLIKGFEEYRRDKRIEVMDWMIDDAVSRLDGVPGWLTLYGNKVSVEGLRHEDALKSVIKEGMKIVSSELEHFLANKPNRDLYINVLKIVASSPSSWGEIKHILNIRGYIVNDGTLNNVIDGLKNSFLIEKSNNMYRVVDPMLKALLVG